VGWGCPYLLRGATRLTCLGHVARNIVSLRTFSDGLHCLKGKASGSKAHPPKSTADGKFSPSFNVFSPQSWPKLSGNAVNCSPPSVKVSSDQSWPKHSGNAVNCPPQSVNTRNRRTSDIRARILWLEIPQQKKTQRCSLLLPLPLPLPSSDVQLGLAAARAIR
jgi:hypothetical protein